MHIHPPLTLLLGACLVAPLTAQNGNEQVTNNEPWFVISTAKHPSTQQAYAYPPTVPTPYAGNQPTTPGVAPGVEKFRVFPGQVFLRLEARQVSGITYIGRNSAATLGQNNSSYAFASKLRPTVARSGGGLDPDMAAAPLLSLPQATGGGGSLEYRHTSTVAPVALTFQDVALTMAYQGGENDNKDANGGQGPSQCTMSSWMDGPTPYVTDGHWQAGVGFTYSSDPMFVLWASFLEEDPVCRAYSNWGQRRIAPLTPPLRGHSVGTYFSDMVSGSGPWTLGFDVFGGQGRAGGIAVPLANFGPVWAVPIPFQGETIEINPGDAGINLLSSLYTLTLSPQGVARGVALNLPRLRGASGLHIGIEFVIVNQQLQLDGTTPAQWILLQ